jgi:hypothetical protein
VGDPRISLIEIKLTYGNFKVRPIQNDSVCSGSVAVSHTADTDPELWNCLVHFALRLHQRASWQSAASSSRWRSLDAPRKLWAEPELHTRPIRRKIAGLRPSTAAGMAAVVVAACSWRAVGTVTHV